MSRPGWRIPPWQPSGKQVHGGQPEGSFAAKPFKSLGERFFSRQLELLNRAGKTIVAYHDAPIGRSLPSSIVIIPPAYGEVKENNLLISAYFVTNGFSSIRFDWTEHVGESEGDIFTSTLSKMNQDLRAILDYLKREYPSAQVGIVSTSLAGRVALKLAAYDRRVEFLICFAPVVDLRHTLRVVYREDLVGKHVGGMRYGILDVLGFTIDADGFLQDALQGSYSDLVTTLEDASHIRVPTLFLIGEKDRWVQIGDARSVFQVLNAPEKEFSPVSVALHRLLENPDATRHALRDAVSFLIRNVQGRELDDEDLAEPDWDDIYAREAHEKARLRELYNSSKTEEREFWKQYLSKFLYIIQIQDYWNLLELIYELLGGAWPGQKILDAGCGNANYGVFLLLRQTYKMRQHPLSAPPIAYFGLDFVMEALSEADVKIRGLQDELNTKMGLEPQKRGFLNSELILADLERGVPFPDNFFDQICCNLVLSYLADPMKALGELCRVLRPGGKIVISSLKPNADLSEIYRNFVSLAESEREIEQARKLLSNAGHIKLKESQGIYYFYSEKELKRMAREVGLGWTRACRSFGNQANVVVGRKGL